MSNGATVTVQVDGGPTITVPWFSGMNAQQAIEGAWSAQASGSTFTYLLQYFGASLGYLVFMINETYETFPSGANPVSPFFFWDFLVNGVSQNQGIDFTTLNANDVVEFNFQQYVPAQHAGTTMEIKHRLRTRKAPAASA